MNSIYDCVITYNKLLNINYNLIFGRKGKTIELKIEFSKSEWGHLIGLHYLKDIPQRKQNSEKIFNNILNQSIDIKAFESSGFYTDIEDRIRYFPYLEEIFDNYDLIFKYNDKLNNFSRIEADFLIKTAVGEQNLFVFIQKNNNNNYFCKSFFPQGIRDYSLKQPKWTLLFKEKVNIAENTKTVLYNPHNLKFN